MGSNTSSMPSRRSSLSRSSDHKPLASHREHATRTSSHSRTPSRDIGQASPQLNENANARNGSKPTTPNIFLDNLVDNDYFSRGSGQNDGSGTGENANQINTGTGDDDYDDDEGIDEDLTTGTTNISNEGDSKNVLIKYYNHGANSKILGLNDSVFVVGSFNGWREKVKLEPVFDNLGNVEFFKTLIPLNLGIYRVKFLINGEIKYSDKLPIATDKSGNFVNWFEIDHKFFQEEDTIEAGMIEANKIYNNKRKSSVSFFNESSSTMIHENPHESLMTPQPVEKLVYSQEIPDSFKSTAGSSTDDILPIDETFLHRNPIPDLPVYLNNTYLNKHFNTHHNNSSSSERLNALHKSSNKGLNSHILPHVNLNHLLTSNIKNNVLSVACTTRYSGKFLTQIMYSPSEIE